MIAVDTNILTRLFVAPADPAEQKQQVAARALLAAQEAFFVPVTVSLELAWVLAGRYNCDPRTVKAAFDHLAALANVSLEEASAVTQAAQWHVKGLDFADALHLARSSHCSDLATFDRHFAQRATRLGLKPAVSAPRES